jgi:hypothetical protein
VTEDDIKRAYTIFRMAMFDNMLNHPVSPLTTSNGVDIVENLVDTRSLRFSSHRDTYLVLIQTILKDILHNKTSRLS